MAKIDAVRMDDDQRDEFLERSGTGVLSLSTTEDDAPYSVPVSYGYDPIEEVFYFRLAIGGETEKGDPDGRSVTFVTYGERDGRWQSVVASGRLTFADESGSTEAIAGLERTGQIPIVDIFGEPTGRVEFEFYRLDPDRFTGRVEQSMEP